MPCASQITQHLSPAGNGICLLPTAAHSQPRAALAAAMLVAPDAWGSGNPVGLARSPLLRSLRGARCSAASWSLAALEGPGSQGGRDAGCQRAPHWGCQLGVSSPTSGTVHVTAEPTRGKVQDAREATDLLRTRAELAGYSATSGTFQPRVGSPLCSATVGSAIPIPAPPWPGSVGS